MGLCLNAKMEPENYDPDNLITNKFPDKAMPPNGKKLDYYMKMEKLKELMGKMYWLRDI